MSQELYHGPRGRKRTYWPGITTMEADTMLAAMSLIAKGLTLALIVARGVKKPREKS